MLTRTALALLLLLPAAAPAQDLDTAVSAVVRISGTRDGTTVRGSGFVVALDRDKATIVTASHVIEGAQQVEVTFAADLAEVFPAGSVLGMDAGSPHGLAVFQVRGTLPAGVTSLIFEIESRPRLGEELFLVGFPQMATAPRTTQRVLSARSGTLLLIDQAIGEGFSGGPVLQHGKVVGVVTDTDDQTTYAVSGPVAREAVEGWGGKLGGQISTSPAPKTEAQTTPARPAPAPPAVMACVPGEMRTENGIDFVRICPGTFIMGSADNDPQADADEKPAHEVTITSEFWIGKTEITNQQYRRFKRDHYGEDELPAISIGWIDPKAACESFGGRLPTEAEWEYAARAGRQTAWSFGADEKLLADYAWYEKNAGNKLHPVATRKPNDWGLYDMHGNVYEWVADRYAAYSAAAQRDPTGPATGEGFVYRGGNIHDSAKGLRSAGRYSPGLWLGIPGFRCVLAPRAQP